MLNGYISTDEEAVKLLTNILARPHPRGNGKSIMSTNIDIALSRAIVALEEKMQKENEDAS